MRIWFKINYVGLFIINNAFRRGDGMRIGIGELVVIFLIALVVIGPDKLPEYARQLGKALGELKKSTSGLNEEIRKDVIVPLNEAAQPLREAVEPINDSVTQIKSDMDKVTKTINNPAAAVKDAVVKEMKPEEKTETEGVILEKAESAENGGVS